MIATQTQPAIDRPAERRGRDRLIAPTVGTGALMLIYLLARPYGDASGATTPEAADAFASIWWVVAHVAGALTLASYAWLALRLADLVPGVAGSLSRALGLGGLVLALPYFGAETFALHVIGKQAVAGNTAVLDLVEPIRNQPVAMTMFGLGLVLLAVSAVLLAMTWWRSGTGPAWAVWPLTAAVVLFLPHFFLPPGGRVAYGVLYAVACVLLLLGLTRGRLR
ncbi:hypothetical protein [Ornithinimicrobium faecis]|uniref:DUF4386 family protein n=1 Tax=Ornithinimicrobium faecis TaxID=2934158 RepID=A0ABY4YY81_9MICO|nr:MULTISPECIES: hypothetical protein [unclassified Ornithinimicrobium]USQ81733.1 hypothetical protein NF556_08840 [Ornithinimicrobium sp. HY1793]